MIRDLERNLCEDIKEKETMLAEAETLKEEQDKDIQEYKNRLEAAEKEGEIYLKGIISQHAMNKELNETIVLCQNKIEELEKEFMWELAINKIIEEKIGEIENERIKEEMEQCIKEARNKQKNRKKKK